MFCSRDAPWSLWEYDSPVDSMRKIGKFLGRDFLYLASLSTPGEEVQEGSLVHEGRSLHQTHSSRPENLMWLVRKSASNVRLMISCWFHGPHQTSYRPNVYSRAVRDLGLHQETIEKGLRWPNL